MNKEQLRQYRWLKLEIEQLQAEINQLRTSLVSTPVLDGMPHNHNSHDRIAGIVAKIVDLESMLHCNMGKSIELRGAIEQCIEVLPIEHRVLMRLRYIEGLRWEQIALKMHYSWRQIHYIHGAILHKIAH